MRVSRVQAEENRQTVIDVASRLFREHGFDGIGLKDLMEGAGFTHGAFYKQFASKEDLAALAGERAMEFACRRWRAAAEANHEDPLGEVLGFYLTMEHRAKLKDGCPVTALGADAARHGLEVRASFEAGIREQLAMLEGWIATTRPADRSQRAMAMLSTMVGAIVLARAVNDTELARDLLDAAAGHVRALAAPGKPGPDRAATARPRGKRSRKGTRPGPAKDQSDSA